MQLRGISLINLLPNSKVKILITVHDSPLFANWERAQGKKLIIIKTLAKMCLNPNFLLYNSLTYDLY